MLKLKAAFFLSVLALAACSGGGSSDKKEDVPADQQEQLVQQYNLPPAPDAELAKTQVIDTNENGIRDETERRIAFENADEGENVVKMGFEMARLSQSSLNSPQDSNTVFHNYAESLLLTGCIWKKYENDYPKIKEVMNKFFGAQLDTKERKETDFQVTQSISGNTIEHPSDEEIEAYCSEHFSE